MGKTPKKMKAEEIASDLSLMIDETEKTINNAIKEFNNTVRFYETEAERDDFLVAIESVGRKQKKIKYIFYLDFPDNSSWIH